MKKILVLVSMLFVLFALAACGGNGNNDATELPGSATQSEGLPTIEELGEIIVAVGTFWEDWWTFSGLFAFENIEWFEWGETPEYLSERGHDWGWFSPESGLENDIRNFFLQHYTKAELNAELNRRFFPIVEYNGLLYIAGTRAGLARPSWETAAHILLEQDGGRAVVETTVLVGGWHRTDLKPMDYAWEERFRFVFLEGRIDDILELLGAAMQNEGISDEELIIQIDVATVELLTHFPIFTVQM